MTLLKTLWLMLFCVSTGCTLSVTNYGEEEITVYSGQSVLLPCSCTEPQAKPPSFTWTKLRDHHTPEIILTQSDLYRGRVVFNNTSPGNLSILLSDLTEDDPVWYRCQISHEFRDIKLTVKGCTLSDTQSGVVKGSQGQSVLLPCSCTEPQAKPPSFTWTKLGDHHTPEIILTQSDLYRGRVKVFNNTSPGNLSILLSDLTEDDQGWYRCGISETQMRDIKIDIQTKLFVTLYIDGTLSCPLGADTVGTSEEDPSASPHQNNTIQYILLVVLPVILIIAGVALYIYKRNKSTVCIP
uniref:Ig-like domain-containing protein n=1 Tax=Hucho hucho TaxID=62062 RepID=A0A4W5KZR8_9TELE